MTLRHVIVYGMALMAWYMVWRARNGIWYDLVETT